jgi:PAS domain S-box-containing protein
MKWLGRGRRGTGLFGWWKALDPRAVPRSETVGKIPGGLPVELANLTLEQSTDAVYWVDSRGRILYANQAAADMLGYACEELWRMKVPDIDPSSSPEFWEPGGSGFPDRTLRGMKLRLETHHRTRDGRLIPVEIVGRMTEIDGRDIMISIARDLTDRRRAARELEDGAAFLRSLADAVPGSLGYWDRDRICRFANRGYERIFGRAPEEVLGKTMSELLGDRGTNETEEHVRAVLAGEPRRFERTIRDFRGEEMHAMVHYVPHEVDGEVRGFVAAVTDVTPIKVAERRLESMNAQLQERTLQAEEANRVKGEFLANVSHEIRTPLNGVIGMAALLLDAESDPDRKRSLQTILCGGETLLSLIDELLDLSKLESGRFEVEKVAFDVERLVQEVCDLIRPRARSKEIGFTVQVEIRPELRLLGDPLRLRQVLMNLLGNAVKFTKSGGIRLRAWEEAVSGGKVRLRVSISDTGIGIPADRKDAIFEKFTQVDASVSRRYGGTGLGLAICRELVERMGGRIGVESEVGKGSTFCFDLPMDRAQADDRSTGSTERSASGERSNGGHRRILSPRVLVADDNAANRAVVLGLLRKAGCQGVAVADGALALDLLARECFDMVLMDVQMPEVDGLEATRRFRSPEFATPRRGIPVVALTASAMETDRQACREAGMDDFLSKPLFYSDLVRVIDQWIPDDASEVSDPGSLA